MVKKQNGSKVEANNKQKVSKSETNVNVNVNENVNENVNVKDKKIHFADYVSMTNAEYEKLISTYGKDFVDQCILQLDNYKGASGKKYKSDYRAILSWVVDKVQQKKTTNKNGMNDFKELWEEARIEDEQNRNSASNNSFSW